MALVGICREYLRNHLATFCFLLWNVLQAITSKVSYFLNSREDLPHLNFPAPFLPSLTHSLSPFVRLVRWNRSWRVRAHRVLKEEIFASGMLAMTQHRQLPHCWCYFALSKAKNEKCSSFSRHLEMLVRTGKCSSFSRLLTFKPLLGVVKAVVSGDAWQRMRNAQVFLDFRRCLAEMGPSQKLQAQADFIYLVWISWSSWHLREPKVAVALFMDVQ